MSHGLYHNICNTFYSRWLLAASFTWHGPAERQSQKALRMMSSSFSCLSDVQLHRWLRIRTKNFLSPMGTWHGASKFLMQFLDCTTSLPDDNANTLWRKAYMTL